MVSEDLLHLIAESAGVSPLTDVHDMVSPQLLDPLQYLHVVLCNIHGVHMYVTVRALGK